MTINSKEELASIQNVARILEIGMLMQLFVDADSYKYPITVESPEHGDILLSNCKRQYDEQSEEMLDTILVNKVVVILVIS